MLTRTPLREEVYREIISRINRGDLQPGSRVRDTALAAQLGVSRTPVREALLRLTREGVLQSSMGRGFSVQPLDSREMRETGAILTVLECLALQTCGVFPENRLAGLEAIDRELAQTRGDPDRCVGLDEEWHRTLLQDCPNRRLTDLIATLWQVPRRYMRAYLQAAGRVSLSTQHHARILEALRRDDREAAVQRFARHWERGVEELGAWIER
jgi:DNA-binding GntR family transcriptional regulator